MYRTDLASGLGQGVQSVKFSLTYSDLTTAGLTQTIQLKSDPGGNAQQTPGTTAATLNSQNFQLPQGGVILYVRVKHSVAFAASAATSITVSIGKTGGTGTDITVASGNLMAAVADGTLQETFAVANAQHAACGLTANFTSIAGNLSTFTAGQVDIYIVYLNVSSAATTTTSGV